MKNTAGPTASRPHPAITDLRPPSAAGNFLMKVRRMLRRLTPPAGRVLAALLALTAPLQASDQTVILIGLDGFRADYLQKFHPPTLSRLAADGVRAESLTPSFPTLTFPNFYTLATGLRPENHGIINNSMFDPAFGEKFALGTPAVQDGKWWGGEPIWVTAEKQGLRSACMFWPGSEAEIAGIRPTEWRKFTYDLSARDRVEQVLRWLALPPDQRPRLITLYFHEPDTAGHRHGVDSPETAEAVRLVDDAIATLLEGIRAQGREHDVNLIIVSDHGMTAVSPDRTIALSDLIDLDTVQVDFTGALAGLHPLKGSAADLVKTLAAKQKSFQVYRREDLPERFHFRAHRRIPPVILLADEGWTIIRTPRSVKAMAGFFQRGAHGFDPALPSMAGIFLAWGPAFRKSTSLPPFANIQVYNLICEILGLSSAPNDGNTELAPKILRKIPALPPPADDPSPASPSDQEKPQTSE